MFLNFLGGDFLIDSYLSIIVMSVSSLLLVACLIVWHPFCAGDKKGIHLNVV